jgi:NAD(P)-dependent dehydrogenase (short-subunit alcohol dehydrogenase family)
MTMGSLQDRVAIITGAASGLGFATANRMAAEGARVVVADIDHERAATAARSIGDAAIALAVDVSDEQSVQTMVAAVAQRLGRIDIVHNNAAALGLDVLGRDGDVVDMDVHVWDRTMAVNLRGPMLMCKHAIPLMLTGGGGAIVNTSSLSGLLGEDNHLAYACSKAALLAFTRHVANMHGARGIRCNAVAPGLMLTDLAIERLSARQLKGSRAERLLENASRPEDVANLVVFLASDQASCITGQTYVIDAGTMAKRPRAAMHMWEDMLQTGAVAFEGE